MVADIWSRSQHIHLRYCDIPSVGFYERTLAMIIKSRVKNMRGPLNAHKRTRDAILPVEYSEGLLLADKL